MLARLIPGLGLLLACAACRDRPAPDRRVPPEARVVAISTSGQEPVIAFQLPPLTPEAAGELASRCADGDLDACVESGLAHQSAGRPAEAERAWRPACERNHAEACFLIGNLLTNPFLHLGREREGVEFLQRACAAGHGAACHFLGGIYEAGQYGEPVDAAKAREHFELGCRYGHYWACEKVRGDGR
jgi:TPR repeat protein